MYETKIFACVCPLPPPPLFPFLFPVKCLFFPPFSSPFPFRPTVLAPVKTLFARPSRRKKEKLRSYQKHFPYFVRLLPPPSSFSRSGFLIFPLFPLSLSRLAIVDTSILEKITVGTWREFRLSNHMREIYSCGSNAATSLLLSPFLLLLFYCESLSFFPPSFCPPSRGMKGQIG